MMSRALFSRRGALLAGLATLGTATLPRAAFAAAPMKVYKDPGCGCCELWVQILRDEGFVVDTEHLSNGMLMRKKVAFGVPPHMASCHTGLIDGYVIEGHVPVDDISRLLKERPDAIGLTVPGMPYGSPGMGPKDEREAYDVYLIGQDGVISVFSSYEAGKNA